MIYSLGVLLSQFGISLCSTSGSNCCFLAFSVEFMVWGKNTKVMYQSSSWWGVRSLHFLCDFRKVCACVHGAAVQPFVTPWTVACQAPLSMEFSKQEYWSGLPLPSPGDFLDPGIELKSPAFPALAGKFFSTEPPGKPMSVITFILIVNCWWLPW